MNPQNPDDYAPIVFPSEASPTGVFDIYQNMVYVPKARLKNNPIPLDPSLPADSPNQEYYDCRTIDGWMSVINVLLKQAWVNTVEFNFTHDYSFLKNDPKTLPAVTIVYEIISEVPATMTRSGIKNIKPQIREVIGATDKSGPLDSGCSIVWAQSVDTVVMFSVYADSWTRLYEYKRKFKEFMVTYAGIFIGTGLQQLYWQQSTRDALFQPPQNEAYPNKTLFYFARLEEQTHAKMATLQSILISAGILNPITGPSTTDLVTTVSGIGNSPILPTSN